MSYDDRDLLDEVLPLSYHTSAKCTIYSNCPYQQTLPIVLLQGNPYAFVRFHDLDMAHDAKINLSGKYIGKYQLKIGFGKVHASNMVWIGGISSSVNMYYFSIIEYQEGN